MNIYEELNELINQLVPLLEKAEALEVRSPMNQIKDAVDEVTKAFSGSWIGYHSKVYYQGLKTPPPGAQFSSEWGLKDAWNMGSIGDWHQFNSDQIISYIYEISGNPDLSIAQNLDKALRETHLKVQTEALPILESELKENPDNFIKKILTDIEASEIISNSKILSILKPTGRFWSRDSLAMSQGIQYPPHIIPLSEILNIEHTIGSCKVLHDNLKKSASYLSRKKKKAVKDERIGTNVFLGHGRSSLWRELKDFIENRLSLPCDEFNRVPVAGMTNIARLSEMLDSSAFAFLVLTAEDETKEGDIQARMNVIHEVGLFQGRLGFTKAIVLLEEGCAEFSNIQGLGQIRFPKDNIKAAFEEIRQVLEREKVL